MVADPVTPNVYWTAGRDLNSRIAASKTTDGGASWTRYSLGSTTGYAYSVQVDPISPGTVYVAGYENSQPVIYRTTNGGSSWSTLAAAGLQGYVYTFAIDPTDPTVLWAGTNYGIFKSTNSGSSFTEMSTLVDHTKDVCVDPDDGDRVWVGTYNEGVYVTEDGGSTWTQMNEGLDPSRVDRLAVNPSNWLYAGTYGGSSYRWSLQTGVEDQGSAPIETLAMSVFPNPCPGGSGATIAFSLDAPREMRLLLYDLGGRLVASPLEAFMPQGEHTLSFVPDQEGMAPGVYFCRLAVDQGASIVRRLVVIR
ncbi:hypothetical protein JW921_07780 [Candidatus Fermentibacterales bacterium]|nr:hypothetical protein [Candidatus Fermentibacterales bacterium]